MEATTPTTEQPVSMYQRYRTKALVTIGTAGATLAPYASAATLNESISPIITSVTEIFGPLLDLIVAAVPLVIAIAMIGFVIGILEGILGKLKV